MACTVPRPADMRDMHGRRALKTRATSQGVVMPCMLRRCRQAWVLRAHDASKRGQSAHAAECRRGAGAHGGKSSAGQSLENSAHRSHLPVP